MMRDWSFLQIDPDTIIACGHGGVSKKGREYINSLFDRIAELEQKLKQYEYKEGKK
jgi:hypothetical protein